MQHVLCIVRSFFLSTTQSINTVKLYLVLCSNDLLVMSEGLTHKFFQIRNPWSNHF